MACPRNESLVRLVYNETAADEMAQIQRHLESCEPCRKEVASILALEEALPDALKADSNGKAPDTQCPNAMTLACYLDGSLSPEERQPVEGHLARCQSCLDEIVGTAERAQATANRFRKTPVHLLDQAVRFGHEPARSQDETLVEKVREVVRTVRLASRLDVRRGRRLRRSSPRGLSRQADLPGRTRNRAVPARYRQTYSAQSSARTANRRNCQRSQTRS